MGITLGPRHTNKKVGDPWVPQDVKRRRRDVENLMRRMGTPVYHRARYTDWDFTHDAVNKSPVYDDIYEQTRNRDPLSYGVGYMSKELSDDEWYNSEGLIVKSPTSPGAGWTKAPKYRGFGPGTLTYVIMPDRSQDFYQATTGGPIFKVMTALAIAPWWPDIDDNDLLVTVDLDRQGNIVSTHDRFEVKNVNPITIRGNDRRGRREIENYANVGSFGNSFTLNQSFEMARIPDNDVLYTVEVDR